MLYNVIELQTASSSIDASTSPRLNRRDDEQGQIKQQDFTLLTPCNNTSDLPTSGSTDSFCSTNRAGAFGLSKSRSSDLQHSDHSQRSRNVAWGASAIKHQTRLNSGSRRPRTAPEERHRQEIPTKQYLRSPSTSTVGSYQNNHISIPNFSATRRLSFAGSPGGSDTGFLSPNTAHRMPRMSSFSSISSTTSSFMPGMAVRAGLSGTPAYKTNADDRTHNVGSASNPLAVISQQETSRRDENSCPICVESLDASFRLPGEKAHVIPECGHTIHEVGTTLNRSIFRLNSLNDFVRLALWLFMVPFPLVSLPGVRI